MIGVRSRMVIMRMYGPWWLLGLGANGRLVTNLRTVEGWNSGGM